MSKKDEIVQVKRQRWVIAQLDLLPGATGDPPVLEHFGGGMYMISAYSQIEVALLLAHLRTTPLAKDKKIRIIDKDLDFSYLIMVE